MIQLYQPAGTNLCGQTCIAMLVGVTIEDVCRVIRKRGRTRMPDIIRGLEFYGYDATWETGLKVGSLIPDNAIVNWAWPKQSVGHWMLRVDGIIYDPDGIPPVPGMQKRPGGWISKYIAFRKVN